MKKISLVSALMLVASFNVSALELVVDDFNGAFGEVLTTGAAVSGNFTPSAGILMGGNRELTVEVIDSVALTNVSKLNALSTIVPEHGGGIGTFSNDAGVKGNGTLRYDGGGLGDQFLLAEDISGFDIMTADVLSADFGFNFLVTLFTDATNWSSFSGVLPAGASSPFFSLAEAAACGGAPVECGIGGGVDLTNLGAIEILFESETAELDLTIDNIRFSVPEPSSLALLGLGMLSFGFASRRKSKATLQA